MSNKKTQVRGETSGPGVAAAREHITRAFDSARAHGPSSLVQRPRLLTKLRKECNAAPTPTFSVAAQPYVDLACAQVSKRPVVHPHTSDCYTIVVPRRTVDVEALMRKAVEAIERDAKQPHRSDGRHEITTEG